MQFLFEAKDEICLPASYKLVESVKGYIDQLKAFEVDADAEDKRGALAKIFECAMVKCPVETADILSKFWILEEGETAPNVYKTIAAVFNSEAAVDFFTSVLPSLLALLKDFSPLLKSKK